MAAEMPKTIRQIVAENVKDLMHERGEMTIATLAEKSGLSRQVIYSLLDQSTNAKIDTLEAIAGVFGTSPDKLLRSAVDVSEDFQATVRNTEELSDAWVDMGDRIEKVIAGGGAIMMWPGSRATIAALDAIAQCFEVTDDEGKSAILRHALAEAGRVPNIEGAKLPREWRELARLVLPEKDRDMLDGEEMSAVADKQPPAKPSAATKKVTPHRKPARTRQPGEKIRTKAVAPGKRRAGKKKAG